MPSKNGRMPRPRRRACDMVGCGSEVWHYSTARLAFYKSKVAAFLTVEPCEKVGARRSTREGQAMSARGRYTALGCSRNLKQNVALTDPLLRASLVCAFPRILQVGVSYDRCVEFGQGRLQAYWSVGLRN
jgi:hypothetical protein